MRGAGNDVGAGRGGQPAAGPGLRGQVLELGGPDTLAFNQFAVMLQQAAGRRGSIRHIPRPALQTLACLTAAVKPGLARQARAALAMDALDMTFDPAPTRQAFPDLPETSIDAVLHELLVRTRWAAG